METDRQESSRYTKSFMCASQSAGSRRPVAPSTASLTGWARPARDTAAFILCVTCASAWAMGLSDEALDTDIARIRREIMCAIRKGVGGLASWWSQWSHEGLREKCCRACQVNDSVVFTCDAAVLATEAAECDYARAVGLCEGLQQPVLILMVVTAHIPHTYIHCNIQFAYKYFCANGDSRGDSRQNTS